MTDLKHCPRCERTLPVAVFNASARYRVQGYCRDCQTAYGAAWHATRKSRPPVERGAYLAELRREAIAVERAGGLGAAGGR